MNRRKRNSSLLKTALNSDWKFSAFLTVLILATTFILLPTIHLSKTFTKILLPMAQSVSILIAALFAMISLSKLMIEFISNRRQKTDLIKPTQANHLLNKSNSIKRLEPTISQPKDVFRVDEPDTSRSIHTFPTDIQVKWTNELINSLDWKRFEDLCSYYFDEVGVKNKQTSLGADGGIDIILYEDDSDKIQAIVQCKKWTNLVGVKLIRELLGVMHHMNVAAGYFISTNKFNNEAIKLAAENNINLIDGDTLVSKLRKLSNQSQKKIYELVTSGDYTTPTCVKCGAKMVIRKTEKKEFWGCKNYPKCRTAININSKLKSVNLKNSLNHLLY